MFLHIAAAPAAAILEAPGMNAGAESHQGNPACGGIRVSALASKAEERDAMQQVKDGARRQAGFRGSAFCPGIHA
jgi:hypothetical protein